MTLYVCIQRVVVVVSMPKIKNAITGSRAPPRTLCETSRTSDAGLLGRDKPLCTDMVCDIGQLETCRSDDAVLILRAICSRKLRACRMEVLVEERGSYICN